MKKWLAKEWKEKGKYITLTLALIVVVARAAMIENPHSLKDIGMALGSMSILLVLLCVAIFNDKKQNFLKLTEEKDYVLWRDWHVALDGKYEHVNNGDSGQLINPDGSRVIYGSSFMLQGVDNVKDEIQYIDFTEDEEELLHLTASVSQYNEFLAITVTFTNPLDEEWARSVIESVRRAAA